MENNGKTFNPNGQNRRIHHEDLMINKKNNEFVGFAEKFIANFQLVLFASIIIFCLIIAAVAYLIYSDSIDLLNNQAVANETTLNSKLDELKKLQSVKLDYSDLEQSEQDIMNILPDKKDIPNVITEIQALVAANNLSIDSMNIGVAEKNNSVPLDSNDAAAAPDKQSLKELKLTLQMKGGGYFELKKFISDIEKSLKLMNVLSINYSAGGDGYSVVLKTYYLE